MRWSQAAAEALGNAQWREQWHKRLTDHERRRSLVSWCQGRPWTWFVTQTFRQRYSLNAALRVWSHFLAGLTCSWTVEAALSVAEPHMDGSAHVHALVLTPEITHPQRVYRAVKEKSFLTLGIARWTPFDHRRGAARYCVKYLWKTRTETEWAIYPD